MCHVASMAVVFGGLAVIQLRLIVPVTQSTSFGSNNSDSHGVTVGCILFGISSAFIEANLMKNITDIDCSILFPHSVVGAFCIYCHILVASRHVLRYLVDFSVRSPLFRNLIIVFAYYLT